MSNNKITLLSEQFEVEQTGEMVEGITVIIDGQLKKFLEVIQMRQPSYSNNISIIQDALMKGLEQIKNSIH